MASVPPLPPVIEVDSIGLELNDADNTEVLWAPPANPPPVKKELSKFIDYSLTPESGTGGGEVSNTFGVVVTRKGGQDSDQTTSRRSRAPMTKFADDVVEPSATSTSGAAPGATSIGGDASGGIREDDSKNATAQAAALLSTPVGKAFGTFMIQSSTLTAELAEDYASARCFIESLPANPMLQLGANAGSHATQRKKNFGPGASTSTGLVSTAATSGLRFLHPSADNRHFCITPGWQLYLKNSKKRASRPVVDLSSGAAVMQIRSSSSPAQFARNHRMQVKRGNTSSGGSTRLAGGKPESASSRNSNPSAGTRTQFLDALQKQRHREWREANKKVVENRSQLRGSGSARLSLLEDTPSRDWENPLPPPEEFHTVSLLLLQAKGFTNEPGDLLLDYIQAEAKRKQEERINLELFGPDMCVSVGEVDDGTETESQTTHSRAGSRRGSVGLGGSMQSNPRVSRANSELSSRGMSVHKQHNVIVQQVKNHRYLVRNNEECWISLKGVVFSMHINQPLRTAQLLQQERYDHRVLDGTEDTDEKKVLPHNWLGDVNFNVNNQQDSSPGKRKKSSSPQMASPRGSKSGMSASGMSGSGMSFSGLGTSGRGASSPAINHGAGHCTGASAAARNAKPKHPLLGDSEGRRLYYRIYLAPVYSGRDCTAAFKQFPKQYDTTGFGPVPQTQAQLAALKQDKFATEAERAEHAAVRAELEAEAHVNAIFELFLQDFTVVGPLLNGEKFWFD